MPVIFYDTTGLSLYVKFDDDSNTVVDLTEGTGLNKQRYEATDDDIATAGLPAGTYTAAIMEYGATSPADNDAIAGVVGKFVFDGSNEVADDLTAIAQAITDIQGVGFTTGNNSLVQMTQSLVDILADTTTVELLQSIQGAGFTTDGNSLVKIVQILGLIMGTGFDSGNHSLVELADALGIGSTVPPPDPPSGTVVTSGVPVTEIFNISTSQVPISYNINTGTSVTSINPSRSGTLYVAPNKRVSIESSRLISSQIDNYVNEHLIEIYKRVVQA